MHTHKLFLLLGLAAPFLVAGTDVYQSKHRNETARLEYSWIENGCVTKELLLTAAVNEVREDGTATANPVATLSYGIYDYCDPANVTQTFWWGKGTSFSLTVASNLRSASLVATGFTVAGDRYRDLERTNLGTKSLNIDVRWNSNDPKDKTAGTWVTRMPGYMEVSHFNGSYRTATATGLISDGTGNWFPVQYEGNLVQIFRTTDGQTVLTKE